ncbi:MAG: hypothetical protein AVDCRST_MAG65-317, partial [uncultured Solirubrobacteraceae bacterium]
MPTDTHPERTVVVVCAHDEADSL